MTVSFLETGVLYCEDNLRQLAQFPDECIDLIYLDPPFFSNRYYEVIWGDDAEVRSFEDRWEGSIQVYINWMRDRVVQMRRILRPTGSLYLHCDWHAGHYLKVMCDQIFGRNNFLNEIIWSYRTGGASKRHFARKHDTILLYAKTAKYTFNFQKEKSYMMHKYGFRKSDFHVDEGGQYTWVFMRDVWDIASVGSADKQRLHYPTQKPEALLERIIQSSSNEGNIVLDPFCGCGTTVAVAERMNRQWIGIDISPTAVNLMKRRLERATSRRCIPKVIGLPVTADELPQLKPFEFQNWVIQRFWGTHSPRKSGDMGIDGYSFMVGDPIQVKQSDHVGRNVIDNFETAVRRAGKDKGYVVGFSFTRGAYEEVARARWEVKLDIRLVTIKELLTEGPYKLLPELASVTDLPSPPTRSKEARPSAQELIESDQRAV